MAAGMSLLKIAARVSADFSQPLSERPDYGTREMVSQEETGIVKKIPGKGYCVRSEKNPDWSGGCYPTKGEADERLKQVEKFKHMKKNSAESAEADNVKTSQQEQQAKAPPGWKKTVEKMKKHEEIDNPFALAWYMKNKGAKPHKKSSSKIATSPVDVEVVMFEWDPGDERSHGVFQVEADTPVGKLVGKGLINSRGSQENQEWTLNGQPLPDTVDCPDFGIPHYYAGHKAISRFEKVKDVEVPETLSEWVNAYLGHEAESGW